MDESGSGYELGSGEAELAGLELQGTALAPATRMIFATAGLRPGMRVLDLGCAAGDVAFATVCNALAARLYADRAHVTGALRVRTPARRAGP